MMAQALRSSVRPSMSTAELPRHLGSYPRFEEVGINTWVATDPKELRHYMLYAVRYGPRLLVTYAEVILDPEVSTPAPLFHQELFHATIWCAPDYQDALMAVIANSILSGPLDYPVHLAVTYGGSYKNRVVTSSPVIPLNELN